MDTAGTATVGNKTSSDTLFVGDRGCKLAENSAYLLNLLLSVYHCSIHKNYHLQKEKYLIHIIGIDSYEQPADTIIG